MHEAKTYAQQLQELQKSSGNLDRDLRRIHTQFNPLWFALTSTGQIKFSVQLLLPELEL